MTYLSDQVEKMNQAEENDQLHAQLFASMGESIDRAAFLTGSRVYGTPRPDSDIDMCVLLDRSEFCKLLAIADNERQDHEKVYEDTDDVAYKFGNLNMICFHDLEVFDAWRRGTEQLKAEKPVTRARAKEVLHGLVNEIKAGRDS